MKLQTNDVRVASGTVEATKQNSETRYGINLAGTWFNGWGKCPVEKGSIVSLKYVERKGFRNIVSVDVPVKLSGPVTEGYRPSDRDRAVAYCVGVKAAANLHAGSDVEEAWQHFFEEAEAIGEWLLKKMSQPKVAATKAAGAEGVKA